MEGSRPDLPRVPHEPRHVNDLSSLFQLREHLACGGVALVGKAPQFLKVALLASKLDEPVACRGVALVGKAPQFLEVALLASKLDELINRILVTAIGTFWRDG